MLARVTRQCLLVLSTTSRSMQSSLATGPRALASIRLSTPSGIRRPRPAICTKRSWDLVGFAITTQPIFQSS